VGKRNRRYTYRSAISTDDALAESRTHGRVHNGRLLKVLSVISARIDGMDTRLALNELLINELLKNRIYVPYTTRLEWPANNFWPISGRFPYGRFFATAVPLISNFRRNLQFGPVCPPKAVVVVSVVATQQHLPRSPSLRTSDT